MVEQKGIVRVNVSLEEKTRLLEEAWAIKEKAIAEGKIEFLTLDEVNEEVRRRRSE